MNIDVSILIVVHNHEEHLPLLINSLEKFKYLNTFFCDAASSDSSRKIIEESSYKDHLLVKKNLQSFSKNNNDLIKHFNLKNKYYLVLNPDTYFDTDFLSSLVSFLENHYETVIVCPKLLYPNGRLQKSWKKFPSFFQVVLKRIGLRNVEDEKKLQDGYIDWCLGACMLIRSSFIKKRGFLFDERYRLYCEDIDICFSAKIHGYKVFALKEAYIYHFLGESSSRIILSKYNIWNIASIIKFLLKWNFRYFTKKS